MGTWGDGLYDNDSALDGLADLVDFRDEDTDLARVVARVGLLAWMKPVSLTHRPEPLWARVDAFGDALQTLPADTRAALQALRDDPERATAEGSRTREAYDVIGDYSDGPRIDALVRFPGAQPVFDELAADAVRWLDSALTGTPDLYDAAHGMVALGILIELAQAGLWTPDPAHVDRWRAAFTRCDRETRSERGFWWKYVRRVQRGFDLLAPPPAGAQSKPARPIVRKRPAAPPAPTGPVERFSHPKFGPGTLIARSGAGDSAALELLFDDGVTRKILARFLTPVA